MPRRNTRVMSFAQMQRMVAARGYTLVKCSERDSEDDNDPYIWYEVLRGDTLFAKLSEPSFEHQSRDDRPTILAGQLTSRAYIEHNLTDLLDLYAILPFAQRAPGEVFIHMLDEPEFEGVRVLWYTWTPQRDTFFVTFHHMACCVCKAPLLRKKTFINLGRVPGGRLYRPFIADTQYFAVAAGIESEPLRACPGCGCSPIKVREVSGYD